ncbi:MAG: hypothetical protein ACSLE6_13215 [Mycobacterium sp.]
MVVVDVALAPAGSASALEISTSEEHEHGNAFSGNGLAVLMPERRFSAELLHAPNCSPHLSAVVLGGHSEGTHVSLGHTVVCGVSTPHELDTAGEPVEGGCQAGVFCKRRRSDRVDILDVSNLPRSDFVVFLVCNSFSLSATTWATTSNLALSIARQDRVAIMAVGNIDEARSQKVAASLLPTWATTPGTARICNLLNQELGNEVGGFVIVRAGGAASSRGTNGATVLRPSETHELSSGASVDVEQTMPEDASVTTPYGDLLAALRDHPEAIVSTRPNELAILENFTRALAQGAADQQRKLESWLMRLFATERVTGDSVYLPDLIGPVEDVDGFAASSRLSCPVCGSKVLERSIAERSWHEVRCPGCGPLTGASSVSSRRMTVLRTADGVQIVYKGPNDGLRFAAAVRDEAQGKWLCSQSGWLTWTKLDLPFLIPARSDWGYAWLVAINETNRFFIRTKVWMGTV